MSVKLILVWIAGATLAYAGVLTLANSLPVGSGMLVGGSCLMAVSMWKAFRCWWNPSSGMFGPSVKSGRSKKKVHLRIVGDENEEHRTYH